MISREYLKREIFTVPNMLSFLRLLLIPVFAVLYLTGRWLPSIIVLAVSSFSDLLDGKLARKLGQVSELGVLLDPLADKLTQGTIVICMGIKYPIMWYMFGVEVLKEGFMIAAGAYTLKHYGSKLKGAEWFGKVGLMLSMFARGLDETPVSEYGEAVPVRSIGNSTTTPRDLVNSEDVKLVLYLLSESVAKRLRENCLEGQVVEVYVRDNGLASFHQQRKLRAPTCISAEIESEAAGLFSELYRWEKPIRSIGIRVADLRPVGEPRQLNLFVDESRREKLLLADSMTEKIRSRFGFYAIQRGIMYRDPFLSSLDAAADDHMIHPHSYFERGSRTGCEKLLAVSDSV